tara:strand:- start:104711 stop:105172 length:462 start_codon:yes stop_codon:yes gene_type:complete
MVQFLRLMLFAALLLSGGAAQASDELNVDNKGIMVKGYDVVAYFTLGMPTRGVPGYVVTHDGGTYLFSSAEHQKLFEADPVRYAPAYGGFCSYGVRVGKKFEIDPHAWKIVGDRLFLQLDRGTHILWLEDLEKNISISDRIWPSIETTPRTML